MRRLRFSTTFCHAAWLILAALWWGLPASASGESRSHLRVVDAEATYIMGDSDTLAGAEEQALLRAKRQAVERAGVYLEAVSEDIERVAKGQTTRVMKVGIRTIAAAVTETQILEKRMTLDEGRVTFYVKIRATVHLDTLAEAVKRMRATEHLAEHFGQLQAENIRLRKEINRLRDEVDTSKAPAGRPGRGQDTRTARNLVAEAIRTRDLPQKIELASLAIGLDATLTDAHVVRGQTYLRIASLTSSDTDPEAARNVYVDRAMADFERTLQLDPGNTWGLLGRGDGRTWRHDYEGAAQDYRRILDSDPLFDLARQRLITVQTVIARTQVEAQRWQAALATLDGLLDGDHAPSWIVHEQEAYLLRSRIHTELGHLDAAAADLSTLLRVVPTNAEALVLRGQVYRRLRQGRMANEDFERACTLGSPEGCAALKANIMDEGR